MSVALFWGVGLAALGWLAFESAEWMGHGTAAIRRPLRTAPSRVSQIVAKRFASGRAARVANEQRLDAFCHRRAYKWADAIREGLDPDIARFIRDQAAAWQLLATSCGRSQGIRRTPNERRR